MISIFEAREDFSQCYMRPVLGTLLFPAENTYFAVISYRILYKIRQFC